VEACQEDSSGHVQEVMTVLRDGDVRLHLGLEIDPADVVRAVEHLRRQGIAVTVRPQQPGYMDTPENVGAYFLDPHANLIERWAPRPSHDALTRDIQGPFLELVSRT
jgi:hypothetical protein